jgi:hypothetical protein
MGLAWGWHGVGMGLAWGRMGLVTGLGLAHFRMGPVPPQTPPKKTENRPAASALTGAGAAQYTLCGPFFVYGRCSAPPSRFSPPGAAVGQGVGWGPQGSLPDPAHLGPVCEKSRFQDVKPLCSKPKSVTNRRVNQVLKRSPRVTDHGCCS